MTPALTGFIDTHCHLDPGYFPDGPWEAMSRAAKTGVTGFVAIGVGRGGLDVARQDLELVRDPRSQGALRMSAGFHPHDAVDATPSALDELRQMAELAEVVAIGEMGLDYHYEHSPRQMQKDVFAAQIAIAKASGKPVVVHSREARADTLDVLRAEKAADVGGILHCFSEDWDFAKAAMDLGFFVSFSGIVTFKNALDIQDVASRAPADRLLVETDSPYLSPVPLRGKPCEPAYMMHTARKIAALRSVELGELARTTTDNACRAFRTSFATFDTTL